MSIKVDPFLHPIPTKLLNDPETQGFFTYLTRWCNQIWNRTGAGTDTIQNNVDGLATANANIATNTTNIATNVTNIAANDADIAALDTRVSVNEVDIDALQAALSITERETAVDTTSSGSETITCTSALTITLEATPSTVTEVVVNCEVAPVVVDGNGENVNDSATYTMLVPYESKTFKYSPLRGRWSIV